MRPGEPQDVPTHAAEHLVGRQEAPEQAAPLEPRREEILSRRELEILELIGDGLFNREIAERLFLSEDTVKTHVHHVLAKLRARSRAHAVAISLRRGLIQ